MTRENKRKTFEKGYYKTHPCHDSFICRVCGRLVVPEGAGSGHRNHCPNCLHRLHVDVEPGDRDYQEAMRPWRDFAGLADFDPSLEDLDGWSPEVVDELMGRLRLSVRTSEGTAFASDEKKMAYYEDTLSLVDRLEAGK